MSTPAPSLEAALLSRLGASEHKVCLLLWQSGVGSVQVGLGGIQAQLLYNLHDLGHPRASWNPVSLSV